MEASKFLRENNDNEYGIVGYKVSNTMTEYGAVKRGVCEVKDGYLTGLIESSIERVGDKIIASPLDGSEEFVVDDDRTVSMNMFCFRDDLFEWLETNLVKFFEENKDDLSKCEYLIPEIVYKAILAGRAKVKMINTTAKWYGMTYREDLDGLKKNIQDMIDNGIYNEDLWG